MTQDGQIYHNIEILFEDNHLLVINKPSNMLSQADKSGKPDVQSVMKTYLKEKYEKPGNVFLALVQRLDHPVGGTMVLARTSKAASRLSEQIRTRTVKKEYLAVVEGHVVNQGRLVHYLRKNNARKKAEICREGTPGAQKAELDVTVKQISGKRSLVHIRLHTGRFHQIRAQLAAAGYPVAGDRKYGAMPLPDNSLALICSSVTFNHPVTKKVMSFKTETPGELPWTRFR